MGAAEGNDACDATLVNHNCINKYKYEGGTCDLQDSQILEREPVIDDEPTSTWLVALSTLVARARSIWCQ